MLEAARVVCRRRSQRSWAASRRASSTRRTSRPTRCTGRSRTRPAATSPLPYPTQNRVLVGLERRRRQRRRRAPAAQQAGHEVVAVTLKLWADQEGDGERSCCSPQAVLGARALAHGIGLPHLTLDLREPLPRPTSSTTTSPSTPRAALRTPACAATAWCASTRCWRSPTGSARAALATGHYARIADDGEGPLLVRAADPHKDQTYMLAGVRPRPARPPALPAGRPHQARGQGHRARGEPLGRGEAREPGPLLPRGHEPRALPRAPRQRARAPRRRDRHARQRARPPPGAPPLHGRAAQGPRRRDGRAAVRAVHRRVHEPRGGRPARPALRLTRSPSPAWCCTATPPGSTA